MGNTFISYEGYDTAIRWVQLQLQKAATAVKPDPKQLEHAFRVLFHVPEKVKCLPFIKQQWLLLCSQYLCHRRG
jgi:hypothetical protein